MNKNITAVRRLLYFVLGRVMQRVAFTLFLFRNFFKVLNPRRIEEIAHCDDLLFYVTLF